MTNMSGLLSPRALATLLALATVVVGCTAGTATNYTNAGLTDQQPADPLQDGLSGTPSAVDPPPIVQGLATAPASTATGGSGGDAGSATAASQGDSFDGG